MPGSLKTVLTLLHSSVTRGSSLCKGSCKVDGREIPPILVCSSSFRTYRGTLPIGAPEGLGEIQILAKFELSS